MSEVKPLTDYSVVLDFSDYLKEKNERDYVFVVLDGNIYGQAYRRYIAIEGERY